MSAVVPRSHYMVGQRGQQRDADTAVGRSLDCVDRFCCCCSTERDMRRTVNLLWFPLPLALNAVRCRLSLIGCAHAYPPGIWAHTVTRPLTADTIRLLADRQVNGVTAP